MAAKGPGVGSPTAAFRLVTGAVATRRASIRTSPVGRKVTDTGRPRSGIVHCISLLSKSSCAARLAPKCNTGQVARAHESTPATAVRRVHGHSRVSAALQSPDFWKCLVSWADAVGAAERHHRGAAGRRSRFLSPQTAPAIPERSARCGPIPAQRGDKRRVVELHRIQLWWHAYRGENWHPVRSEAPQPPT